MAIPCSLIPNHRSPKPNNDLDSDLASLYGVEARVLNQAVKRNISRFPADFMFQITGEELDATNSSQIVMSSGKHRGRRYLPYAFTEQGVAMLSSVPQVSALP